MLVRQKSRSVQVKNGAHLRMTKPDLLPADDIFFSWIRTEISVNQANSVCLPQVTSWTYAMNSFFFHPVAWFDKLNPFANVYYFLSGFWQTLILQHLEISSRCFLIGWHFSASLSISLSLSLSLSHTHTHTTHTLFPGILKNIYKYQFKINHDLFSMSHHIIPYVLDDLFIVPWVENWVGYIG